MVEYNLLDVKYASKQNQLVRIFWAGQQNVNK